MTKSFYSTLVACVSPTAHVGKPRGLPPLPFMEPHPLHPYCTPGYLPALPSAFAVPKNLQSVSPTPISYALHSSWCPIQSLQQFEQPRGLPSLWLSWRKLEKNGMFWQLEQSQLYMESVWGSHCLKAAWFQKWEWKMPSIFRAVARVSSPGILRI